MSSPIDYTIFYKKPYDNPTEFAKNNRWDLFISAYNDSERVKKVFDAIDSPKHWLILPDYGYSKSDFPTKDTFFDFTSATSEAEIITTYFSQIEDLSSLKICIDITGFMRPHLVFLIRFLAEKKIRKFDAVFTDPTTYVKKEKTTFTKNSVELVRQINGCEGHHLTDVSNDILIILSGYDYKLIASVAENKEKTKKIQIFGLPSLQPDMYQENLICAYKAEEAIGGKRFLESHSTYFAPANDPFVTASTIQKIVKLETKREAISNLYVSPLSTKAQTLGLALFYVYECLDKPISIIFPFTTEYTRETTKGISKIWKYTIELP